MPSPVVLRDALRPFRAPLLLLACALAPFAAARAQEGPLPEANDRVLTPAPQQQPPAPIERHDAPVPVPYDPAIFDKPLDPALFTNLRSFDGAPTAELFRDKQFRRLMKEFVPGCMFHYGRDMPLSDALDMALSNSRTPVRVVDNRYVLLSGNGGPYLSGRALLWVDTQAGLGLGAFFFTPTNGEPTPSLAVFSRQVKEPTLALSQLPLRSTPTSRNGPCAPACRPSARATSSPAPISASCWNTTKTSAPLVMEPQPRPTAAVNN